MVFDAGRTALEAAGDGHKPIRHRLVVAKGETTFDCHGTWVSIVRPREQRLVEIAPIVSRKKVISSANPLPTFKLTRGKDN